MGRELPIRELYCPSHFGNFYEVAMSNEMRSTLEEAKFWGYNRFSDWFDTIDLYNLYDREGNYFNMPEAMWERKFENFAVAADLGYELGLVVTPNHVFSDQVTPGTMAETGGRYFGQLVCPARTGVTELILENYRKLFKDFAARGLTLSSIAAGAYDYGGCACEECAPWIVTFGKLAKAIVELGKEIFGNQLKADLWAWWWTDEDHENFSDWADREAPGFFSAVSNHILYGEAQYKVRRLPAGAGERSFTHIGYGEKPGLDVYGHYGPTIAPHRLEETYRFLCKRDASGFLAYSEGAFDDVNKAIMGGLASGQFETAHDVLEAYAGRYLGGDAQGWATWLTDMGDVESLDPSRSRKQFDMLARGAKSSERLDMFAEKLAMCEADHTTRNATEWTPDRIHTAEAFLAAKEQLWRGIWRRGLCRHIFRFDWRMPEWYGEYASIVKKNRKDSAEAKLAQA